MSAKLVPLPLGDPPGIQVSTTALKVIDPKLTIEQAGEILANAVSMGDTVRWWVGDLLLYAESRWGEESAQLLDATRLSEHQLTKYRWVAEKVRPSLRRENLSFSHHELVAAQTPDDQARLLAMAEAGGQSVAQFREAIRDHKALFEEQRPPTMQVVMDQPTSTVDAVRGLRFVKETLRTVAGTSAEASDALRLPEAARGVDNALRVVSRAALLEDVLAAASELLAAGQPQTGLPEPAVIVPSGPWDKLSAAVVTTTERRAHGNH